MGGVFLKPKQKRKKKYDHKYAEQARALCVMGYKDEDLWKFFKVSKATFYGWKKEYPFFKKCVEEGKDGTDSHAVAALYRSSLGYEYDELTVESTLDGTVVKKVLSKKYKPPNVHALKTWLYNRRPELFKAIVDDAEGQKAQPVKVTFEVKPSDTGKEPKVTNGKTRAKDST